MSAARRPAAARVAPIPTPESLRPEPLRLNSAELLRGANEVLIEHEAQVYRLRRTALGKLILTK